MLTITTKVQTGTVRSLPPALKQPVPLPATDVSHPLYGRFELNAVSGTYAANAEIFAQDDLSGCLYQVVSGVVRISRLLADGRRQISAFHLPGEIFGLEVNERHQFSAEAINRCKVDIYKLGNLLDLAERKHQLARELWSLALRSLARTQSQLMLLGRRSALERVAVFLLEMADRQSSGSAITLAMSRLDIADYLGLTLETVSRMLGELQDMDLIALPSSRQVEIRNATALRDMIC
jgi:CRP/FNR family nitrogen fixation transcriptional regulator